MSDKTKRIPVIVCGGSAGRAVIYGYADEMPEAGQPFTLHDARMVLYWSAECGGLFGLAATGPAGDTRLTATVSEVQDTSAHQVISVSDEAELAFSGWEPVR